MTKLTGDKKIVRETLATHKGKALVVEVHPRYLRYRVLGSRESYTISHEAAHARAAINNARLDKETA